MSLARPVVVLLAAAGGGGALAAGGAPLPACGCAGLVVGAVAGAWVERGGIAVVAASLLGLVAAGSLLLPAADVPFPLAVGWTAARSGPDERVEAIVARVGEAAAARAREEAGRRVASGWAGEHAATLGRIEAYVPGLRDATAGALTVLVGVLVGELLRRGAVRRQPAAILVGAGLAIAGGSRWLDGAPAAELRPPRDAWGSLDGTGLQLRLGAVRTATELYAAWRDVPGGVFELRQSRREPLVLSPGPAEIRVEAGSEGPVRVGEVLVPGGGPPAVQVEWVGAGGERESAWLRAGQAGDARLALRCDGRSPAPDPGAAGVRDSSARLARAAEVIAGPHGRDQRPDGARGAELPLGRQHRGPDRIESRTVAGEPALWDRAAQSIGFFPAQEGALLGVPAPAGVRSAGWLVVGWPGPWSEVVLPGETLTRVDARIIDALPAGSDVHHHAEPDPAGTPGVELVLTPPEGTRRAWVAVDDPDSDVLLGNVRVGARSGAPEEVAVEVRGAGTLRLTPGRSLRVGGVQLDLVGARLMARSRPGWPLALLGFGAAIAGLGWGARTGPRGPGIARVLGGVALVALAAWRQHVRGDWWDDDPRLVVATLPVLVLYAWSRAPTGPWSRWILAGGLIACVLLALFAPRLPSAFGAA